MRRNGGFTLIELMIVVAIIGILAVIAVPNFMKFMAKSRRTEAKYNLEAIYKAETSYLGEYNGYSTSFVTIRWRPEGTIYYYTFSVGSELYGRAEAAPAGMTMVPTATSVGFTACAWGNIDTDPTYDVWYINDVKNMDINVDDVNT